jgi:hypothetical protein
MLSEEKAVEQMVRDGLCSVTKHIVAKLSSYGNEDKGWRFVRTEDLFHQHSEVRYCYATEFRSRLLS